VGLNEMSTKKEFNGLLFPPSDVAYKGFRNWGYILLVVGVVLFGLSIAWFSNDNSSFGAGILLYLGIGAFVAGSMLLVIYGVKRNFS